MCFCLNLLEPQSNGIGGEVPTLIYSAAEGGVDELHLVCFRKKK